MICFDTETTGIPVRGESDPAKQPRIVELAAIKVDPETLEEQARFSVLINPGIPIPPEVTAIHGIGDADVQQSRSFPHVLKTHILPFWRGEETIVGYNVEFDLEMMLWELRRIGWETRFPYCWDTIDAIQYRSGRRIKLNAWAKESLGEDWAPQTHRAMGDVEMLLACMRKSREKPNGN